MSRMIFAMVALVAIGLMGVGCIVETRTSEPPAEPANCVPYAIDERVQCGTFLDCSDLPCFTADCETGECRYQWIDGCCLDGGDSQ